MILQAARLTAWKGQSVLIEAARLLQERGQLGDAVVVLAGSAQGRGGYAAMLKHEIEATGLTGRVRLVGHVDDVAAAFLTSRVAVIASTEPEAFGRTATEAQAMGTPVIATDIGAPPETVRSTQRAGREAATGWLVPAGDAHALAETLVAALALTPQERQRMGEQARAHITRAFSLAGMKQQTLAIYDDLLGTHLAAQS